MPSDRAAARVAARLGVLRRALVRTPSLGPWAAAPTIALGSGFVLSLIVDALLTERLGTPWRQLVAITAFVGAGIPIWLVVEPARVRRAREVVIWLNGWEVDRWERETGRRLPGVPRAYPGILERLPDTLGLRPLRVELLATTGRFDEARERLAALPDDTPWQRFERAALTEYLGFCGGAPPEAEPMRAAISELAGDDRQLVARVGLALAEARRTAIAGRDPSAVLANLRVELGDRPRRYGFGQATGVVLVVGLIGLIAGATIAITSAVLR